MRSIQYVIRIKLNPSRCARNCLSCPICTTQLTVSTMSDAKEGPWILNCNYCMWTSLEIGIKFDRATNIRAQLDKIANGGKPQKPQRVVSEPDPAFKASMALLGSPLAERSKEVEESSDPVPHDPATRFAALKSFYKNQIALSSANDPPSAAELAYSSPASLARIVNMYTGRGHLKPKAPAPPMREALTATEGLLLSDPESPQTTISHLQRSGFAQTTSASQRAFQFSSFGGGNPSARFVSELRPMPALLRTKRSKRCKACRHILVRPEFKPTSIRYRIKLIALNYVPLATLRPVPNTSGAVVSKERDYDGKGEVVLRPGEPSQWILTLKNPMFDAVKVSLGTPARTPGRWAHRVTVLCPQFEVGANSDVWDEALQGGGGGGTPGGAPEAGKVYERGRNWTSVVVEVVPVGIRGLGGDRERDGERDEGLGEDEDVLEIPIRVRLEWKQSDLEEQGKGRREKALAEGEVEDDGSRELAYWMVLGVGRVE